MGTALQRPLRTTVALIACAAGLAIFFRSFFLSGGDLIIGDMGDGQLIQSIHEHWYRVFRGLDSWLDMGFFYPVSNELGFSDTFLLTGIPYTALRALGVDMYIAYELTQMLLLVVGFFGMYHWLNKYRGINSWISIWGAFVFVIASPIYLSARNSHIQVLSVWMIPLILIFLEAFIGSYQRASWKPAVLFLLISIIFGALLYSTFYAAFFLSLGVLLLVLISIVIHGPRKTVEVLVPPRKTWKFLIPGLLVAGLWIGLFLWTYLPVHRDQGGHSIHSVLASLPHVWDLLNHSKSNLLWGRFSFLSWDYDADVSWVWTYELGLTFTFAVTVLVFAISIIRNRRQWNGKSPDVVLSAFVLVIVLILMIKVWKVSLWALVYYSLPGADAIRVIPRINAALMVPGLFLFCCFIQALLRSPSFRNRSIASVFMVLVAVEQVHLVENSSISRAERKALYERIPTPPADVDAVYFLGEPTWGWHKGVTINSAMYLSQKLGIPTVNGRSGMSPPNWLMGEMGVNVTPHNLVQWAKLHSMTDKVYYCNMDSGEWLGAIDFSMSAETFAPGQDLMHLSPPEFEKLAYSGWHEVEKGFVWSNGSLARLRLPSLALAGNKQLRMVVQGFVSHSSPSRRIRIQVNGVEAQSMELTLEDMRRELSIPLPASGSGNLEVDFIIENPVRPADVGFNNDERELGFSLMSLVVEN